MFSLDLFPQCQTHIFNCLLISSTRMFNLHSIKLDISKPSSRSFPLKLASSSVLFIKVNYNSILPFLKVIPAVILDSTFSHPNLTYQQTYQALPLNYCISKIRLLTTSMSIILILATIFSPLDYCNSLLTGPPTFTLILLQSIMNTATRMKMWYHKVDHITWFKTLQWLSIFLRIKVKNFIMFTLPKLHSLLCCSWITLYTL